ncbi:hypothetical protein [Catenulispora pinisilvae]|uniref:hypothetical protein n=1 Tax=Catenulispora pinisilvae TaxID=2705253 RepID=UPI001890DE37|nr:hypothetical protein [Catenulispora pinisilvae]
MGSVRPLIYPVPRPGHPLADASSPKLAAVIILVIVLAAMGWSEEQVLALLAVLFPLAFSAGGEGQA